ncbi:hypothetical protein K2P47_03805 [Patescibacteria group bacterium]|nr:hypothetical protein [Patescibacteria group bacterium]
MQKSAITILVSFGIVASVLTAYILYGMAVAKKESASVPVVDTPVMIDATSAQRALLEAVPPMSEDEYQDLHTRLEAAN